MSPLFRSALTTIWGFAAMALGCWLLWESLDPRQGFVVTSVIGMAYALAAVIGAALGFLRWNAGTVLLGVVSGLALAYALAFLLFQGLQDRGLAYGACVGGFALLSAATLYSIRKGERD